MISFAPFLPLWAMIAIGIVAALLAGFGPFPAHAGAHGCARWRSASSYWRLPTRLSFPRTAEPLPTIVAIVVDRSQSQLMPERIRQTDAALKDLTDRLAKFPGIEPRIVDVRDTARKIALHQGLRGLERGALRRRPGPRRRRGLHHRRPDPRHIPEAGRLPGFNAPVHALITGRPNEFDRRIEVVRAPRFSLVNAQQELTFRVIDDGKPIGTPADVTIRINGEEVGSLKAEPGKDTRFDFKLNRAGTNVIDFEVATVPGELTTSNNRAVQLIDGIRQNLRVLLVSGEPHAGERAWRNLLKSDALVDLVHFTILRPPEKAGRHAHQRTLADRLPDARTLRRQDQGIRPDRLRPLQNRGVLPILYYDNIAEYVRKGVLC